jgi:dTDP-4-amino-4,6-dideoxygalactose transaminase
MTDRRRENAERVPLNDLAIQWRQIEAGVMPEMKRLFDASAFSLGPWVERFEEEVAAYLGVPHAIGVNSGTSALHLAMIAAGVSPGDKVLVPANTFIATAWAVLYAGAEPVFCDVESSTWCMDPVDAERRIAPGVKAVVPVHLYGQPAKMDDIMALARHYRLAVIEDVAQAIGARFQGRTLGSWGNFGGYSFYPGKNLGAAGEGGLVVTSDATAAARIRTLRHHAQTERYVHAELGFNYRMDGIQGLVLSHKLRHLDRWTVHRREIAQRYRSAFADLPLELPSAANGDHVWHLFVVHTPRRDALRAYLAEHGIDAGLHYPVPLHRQPCFARRRLDPADYPNAERNSRECLSLPLYAGMTDGQATRVIDCVRAFFRAG